MSRTAYTFGQPVTPAEVNFVLQAGLKPRRRGVNVAQAFRALVSLNRNLVEHLVNKHRGIAFDSGEDGFAHRRVN